jgi:hypothetical protein
MKPHSESQADTDKNTLKISAGVLGENSAEHCSLALNESGEHCSEDYFCDPDKPLMSPEQIAELAGRGVYSGRGLLRHRPEIYKAVVRALNEGIGLTQIAKAFGVSPSTVYAVREREYRPNWQDKTRIKKMVRKLANFTLERIEEELPTLPADKLPVLMGILIDKMQALDGEPGSIVEHRQTVTLQSWTDLVASLPEVAPEKMASGTVIEE